MVTIFHHANAIAGNWAYLQITVLDTAWNYAYSLMTAQAFAGSEAYYGREYMTYSVMTRNGKYSLMTTQTFAGDEAHVLMTNCWPV